MRDFTDCSIRWSLALLLAAGLPTGALAATQLVAPGGASVWQYLDAGKVAAGDWSTSLTPAGWKQGAAPLGYGHAGNATTVSYGPAADAKAITTYFRRQVDVSDPNQVATLTFDLRRDDGAVVYWNGREILRTNMPAGAVTAQTRASATVQYGNEIEYPRFVLPASSMEVRKGANVLAVEIHQVAPTSSDIVFDLDLHVYAPGEALPNDDYAKAYATLASGDIHQALNLILQTDLHRAGFALMAMAALERFIATGGKATDPRYGQVLDLAHQADPDDVDVTHAWIRQRVDSRKDLALQPARRPLPASVDPHWRFIADTPSVSGGPMLTRAQMLSDVDDLELILENCYSYLERRGVDYRAALDALRVSISTDLPSSVFQHRVGRLMTIFGDLHSSASVQSEPRLPLRFVMDGERIAVLAYDRSALLDPAHPYLSAINGKPVEEWLAAAEQVVTQSSPQQRRMLALEQLRRLAMVARQLQLPATAFELTLRSADDKDTLRLPVQMQAKNPPAPAVWPQHESALRADNIGYLRIASMGEGPELAKQLDMWMAKFSGTRGLVIDVRGNTGGMQDTLQVLMPWLIKQGSPMKIINVAAYRMPIAPPVSSRAGFLGMGTRALFPLTSAVWNADEASQVRAFLATFTPAWQPPAGKFSDWHVMAIRPSDTHGSYDQPVIVLQDAECFSATDNLLGALKGHPNVTLMGTASGGGSGRMADYVLPNSKVRLTLTQMASYTASGMLFDGNGIAPDIVVATRLTDQLVGGSDSVLDAAVARLLGK